MGYKKTGIKLGVKKRSSQLRRRTVRVQGVVETMVRKCGWSDKLFERTIYNVWESVVGKEIATQSVPVSLFCGVLRVDVAHQVYTTELSLMKPEILLKLENQLKDLNLRKRSFVPTEKVVDILFRFNPNITKERNGGNGTKSESSQQQPTTDIRKGAKFISSEMMEQIEAAVSGVSDSELRDALKTLFLTLCSDKETIE